MPDALYSPVSAEQAVAFLRTRYGPHIRGVRHLGHGDWSMAYHFSDRERERVIRFSALREDFDKDRLASAYRAPDLPIPVMEEIGEAFGGFYALSAWANGTALDDLGVDRLRSAMPSLFATLDALRQTDVKHTTGYGLWHGDGVGVYPTWRDYLLHVAVDEPGARIHPWRRPLEQHHPRAAAIFDRAYEVLRELVPVCPETRHLVHCDLLNYNVLVSSGRVSAVLDWGSALYGDFLYDVAWLRFCQLWYPAWQDIDFAAEARRHYARLGLAVPDFEQRVCAYQVHVGLGSLVYNAFRGRWDELDQIAEHTLAAAGLES